MTSLAEGEKMSKGRDQRMGPCSGPGLRERIKRWVLPSRFPASDTVPSPAEAKDLLRPLRKVVRNRSRAVNCFEFKV